jgi:WD40 repeat protein
VQSFLVNQKPRLEVVRQGGRLLGLAFAPDGKTLATSGVGVEEGQVIPLVQLWDPDTGKERFRLKAAGNAKLRLMGALAFSPDGRMLAAAEFQETHSSVTVWELATQQPRLSLRCLQDRAIIRALRFAPDSRSLTWAAGKVRGPSELVVTPLLPVNLAISLQAHKGDTGAVAYSPDGNTLASGGLDGMVKVWDTATQQQRAVLRGFGSGDYITAVAFSPNGKTLVAASSRSIRNTISLWDAATLSRRYSPEEEARREQEEGEYQKKMAADKLADGELQRRWQEEEKKLTDLQRAKLQAAEALAKRHAYALNLGLARQALGLGHLDTAAKLLDEYQPAPGREDMRTFEWRYLRRQSQVQMAALQHHSRVDLVRLAPDGKTVAVAASDHTITLWDLTTGKKRGTIERHPEPVHCLEFSPDSKTLASAGGVEDEDPSGREVRVWAADTGQPLVTLKGHTATVKCLAFAPDSKTLATGAKDNTVRLWSLPSGKMTVLGDQVQEVLAVTFSSDGEALASGDVEGGVRVWDVAARKKRHDFKAEQTHWVFSLHFAPDGKTLLVTDGDELRRRNSIEGAKATTRLWDIASAKPRLVRTWDKISHGLFSPGGKALALTGGEQGVLWDLKEDYRVTRLPVYGRSVSPLAFSPNSRTLLVGRIHSHGSLSALRLLDVETGEAKGIYEGRFGEPVALRLTDAGQVVALAVDGSKVLAVQVALGQQALERRVSTLVGAIGVDISPVTNQVALVDRGEPSVNLWDLDSNQQRTLLIGAKFAVAGVRFSADGKAVILSSFEFLIKENSTLHMGYPVTLKVLDVATGKERTTLRGSPHGMVHTNGEIAAVGHNDETVTLHDLTTGAKLATHRGNRASKAKGPDADGYDPLEVTEVRLSPGGRWVMGKTEDGVSTLWDAATGKVLRTWQAVAVPANYAFSPDEKTLLTADEDGTIRVLDLPALKVRGLFPGSWLPGGACAFTPDGRTATVVSFDNVVSVLDLNGCAERLRLTGHLTAVTAIVWSPNGKTLVTGTESGMVQCWDPITGQARHSLVGHRDSVRLLAFNPDGTTLVSADHAGRLRVWSGVDIRPNPKPPAGARQ